MKIISCGNLSSDANRQIKKQKEQERTKESCRERDKERARQRCSTAEMQKQAQAMTPYGGSRAAA